MMRARDMWLKWFIAVATHLQETKGKPLQKIGHLTTCEDFVKLYHGDRTHQPSLHIAIGNENAERFALCVVLQWRNHDKFQHIALQ